MNLRDEADLITVVVIANDNKAPKTKTDWVKLIGAWFLIGMVTELIVGMFEE